MEDHSTYVKFIESELVKTKHSKVKSSHPINGIVKILNFFLNKKKRNFVFMFPSLKENNVEITIKDIINDLSTCNIITFEKENGFIKILDTSSKYGQCTIPVNFIPRVKQSVKIEELISYTMLDKITSGIYDKFPIV
jgi:hypothetical protein